MWLHNLIKTHKPRYNISLKDDKKYPYIQITKEAFPRILVTRDVVKDGSRYLGPYTDVRAMRRMLETMHRLFRIRSCDYNLPKPNVRVCLDFEIKRCDGPCEGLIVAEAYQKIVDEAALFLTGRHTQVMVTLKSRMTQAAETLKYEEAAIYRDRIQALEQATNRQKVVSNDLTDWDTIAIAREDDKACGVVMEVRDGRLIGRQNYFIGGVLDASEEEVVSAFVQLFYATATFVPKEVCLPCDIENRETVLDWLRDRSEGLVEIRLPQRGDKFRLMKMAENNAKLLLSERRLKRENRKAQAPASVQALQRDLHMEKPPRWIEAVDISNIQGSDPVASLVCFVVLKFGRTKFFAKRIAITDLEHENLFSTRNFYRLPTYYNYGVGSAGLGVFRELIALIKTTNLVLDGEVEEIPLLYHYRILPYGGEHPKIDTKKHAQYVTYWNSNKQVGQYRLDRSKAKYELAMFCEFVPHELWGWFGKNVDQLDMVLDGMKNAINCLVNNDIIHFDAHWGNIMSDGQRVYLADFGLVQDRNFNLSKRELQFFKDNKYYDSGEFLYGLSGYLRYKYRHLAKTKKAPFRHHFGLAEEMSYRMETKFLIQNLEQIHDYGVLNLNCHYVDQVIKYRDIILLMHDFFSELTQNNKKNTKYNHARLRRLLKETKFIES